MEAWYYENLTSNKLVLLLETGYTNSQLAMEYLEQFIRYTNVGPDSYKRVILIDSDISYTTPELTIRTEQMNIIPYPFPSHLTYAMQPLDVAVFQTYKHWHKKAIQQAIRSLDIDYNIASFFQNLTEIRENNSKGELF
jgi:hypothetical protein